MDDDESTAIDPRVAGRVLGGMAALGLAGFAAFALLGPAAEPPPPAVAADPLLARGREIFLERCASCHGPLGRGDGPLSRGLVGPAPRNLSEDPWKHGDRPEQVLAVLENGVKDSRMPAWSGTYGPPDLKAVAAYVYHLANRPVPGPLRGP